MRVVLQRVTNASVLVEGSLVGQIGKGFLLLLGIAEGDSEADLDYLVKKIIGLRIFPDADGKMNLSLAQVGGELLLVSQFTLFADTRKGNRPSFLAAAKPELGKSLYEKAIQAFRASGLRVETGQFGADMKVTLTNDGPVTILLDSKEK